MTGHVGHQFGNYRLLQRLGTGGFAEVYLGEQVYLNTRAAIKILQTRLEEDERERFLQEARLIARLIHPHIVRVLEFGVENEIPFLVMDYAPHGTLRNHFPRGTRLAPESILPYVKQIADALDYAHAQGLVHRDIKPENMLLGREYEVLLSDFGIALIAQSARFESTQEVFGTASYMAPEQIQGKAEPASDQYALGVVLYEWLCNELPFHGSFKELCSQHLFIPPPPLSEKVPGIPPAIAAIVERALRKNPRDRFPNVREMALAFEKACPPAQLDDEGQELTMRRPGFFPRASNASYAPTRYAEDLSPSGDQPGEGTAIPPTQAVSTPKSELPVLSIPSSASFWKKRRFSRRGVILGATATGLAAAGGLTWFSLSHRKTPPPTSTRQFTALPSPSPSSSIPSVGNTILTYRGHMGVVYAVAWSPNGQYIASASADTTVRVWNISTGDTLYTYNGHAGLYNSVFTVGWASNGGQIASGGADGTVQVWDAATGNLTYTYRRHTGRVMTLAWSPDARYIASGGADRTVQVWDTATGNLLYLYPGHTDTVYTLAWSPDGRYIASGSADKVVQVWQAATGTPLSTYHGHTATIYSLAFSHDGRAIASGGADRTVQIWEAATGKQTYIYNGYTSLSTVVATVAWSSDNKRVASGSTDQTVRLWDATTGKNAYTYQGHSGAVFTAKWSPAEPRIASGGADTTVRVWQTT